MRARSALDYVLKSPQQVRASKGTAAASNASECTDQPHTAAGTFEDSRVTHVGGTGNLDVYCFPTRAHQHSPIGQWHIPIRRASASVVMSRAITRALVAAALGCGVYAEC